MRNKANELWPNAALDIILNPGTLLKIPVMVWNWLNGLFKKHELKDKAMFHCSNCGNNFVAKRYITRETFDDDSMTITTIYFPMKCPNCGEWATTQKTIQYYRMSRAEA